MASDSYTLREVAELLGVSKRTLQRRIQEGAFPGRFLAPGRHGLETRIPTEDVQRAFEELRRRGAAAWRAGQDESSGRGGPGAMRHATVMPARELESLVPYRAPELVPHDSSGAGAGVSIASAAGSNALTSSDLESLRDAMLAIVREEREMFLGAVREALMARDREIVGLKQEMAGMRRIVDAVRGGIESLERRLNGVRAGGQTLDVQAWADMLVGPASASGRPMVDVDALLRELGELESMIVALDRK
jgi:excisionase family DNA binding protein